VGDVARRYGMPGSQLALLWVMNQPAVTSPIIGPRTQAHLAEALAVLEMQLDPLATSELDAIVPPGSAVSDFHNTSGWMKMKLPA